eukprot:12622427-Alexandrium_andersonii.AAC.1
MWEALDRLDTPFHTLIAVQDQYQFPKLVGQCARRLVAVMSPANACAVLAMLRTAWGALDANRGSSHRL